MEGIAPCQHQEACYDKPLIGTISMFDFPGSRERLWLRRRIAIQKLRERSKFTFENTDEIKDVVLPDDNFTAIQLDEAIRSLPKGNRLVFMLMEVEGYKHREVAEMLQISEGTSKSQLNYAKKLLRQILKDYKSDYAAK